MWVTILSITVSIIINTAYGTLKDTLVESIITDKTLEISQRGPSDSTTEDDTELPELLGEQDNQAKRDYDETMQNIYDPMDTYQVASNNSP